MGYRINLGDGTSIDCSTIEEAMKLVSQLRDGGLIRIPAEIEPVELTANPWGMMARAFAAVREYGDAGVSSAELAKWLSLDAALAIGPKVRVWRRLLQTEAEIDIDSVIQVKEVSRGHRRWFPGANLEKALSIAVARSLTIDPPHA